MRLSNSNYYEYLLHCFSFVSNESYADMYYSLASSAHASCSYSSYYYDYDCDFDSDQYHDSAFYSCFLLILFIGMLCYVML